MESSDVDRLSGFDPRHSPILHSIQATSRVDVHNPIHIGIQFYISCRRSRKATAVFPSASDPRATPLSRPMWAAESALAITRRWTATQARRVRPFTARSIPADRTRPRAGVTFALSWSPPRGVPASRRAVATLPATASRVRRRHASVTWIARFTYKLSPSLGCAPIARCEYAFPDRPSVWSRICVNELKECDRARCLEPQAVVR